MIARRTCCTNHFRAFPKSNLSTNSMRSLMKLAAVVAFSVLGLLHPTESVSQTIVGPTTVTFNSTETYTLWDDLIYGNPSFTLSGGGGISNEYHSGFDHSVDVTWTEPGTHTLSFRNNSVVIATLDVTVGCPKTYAPSTTFTFASTCTGVNITRSSNPPGTATWYWQTTATGTSTANSTATYSFDGGEPGGTVYLRARNNTYTDCWSATSTAVVIPGTPDPGGAYTCGPGSVNLTATYGGNGGTIVLWWGLSCTGGTFYEGPSWQTPSITTTTTYYISTYNATTGAESKRVPIVATVNPVSVGGTVSPNSLALCSPGGSTLTLSGHAGAVLRWEWSSNFPGGGMPWHSIANTTTSLTFSGLTSTRTYRAVVKNGPCSEVPSSSTTVTIYNSSIGGVVNGGNTQCSPASGTLTLTGYTGTVQRWQWSPNGTGSWTNITNTTPTLNYSGQTVTRYFRAWVKAGTCAEVPSSNGTVFVSPPSVGGVVGPSDTKCGPASGSLSLTLHTGAVQRWEYSTNAGSTWTPIANTTATYNYSGVTVTTHYRAVVKSGVCAEASSSPAIITISLNTVAGTVTPHRTTCAPASGTLTLSGHTGAVQRWQYSTNAGSTWTNITHTSTTYNYSGVNVTTHYRAVVKSGACPELNSTAAIITIITPGGSVTGGTTACGPVAGTLTLTGHTGTVVRWEYSYNGGAWTTIANTTTSQAYSNITGSWAYRAIVNNATCGNIASTSAPVIGYDAGIVTPANTTACSTASGTLYLTVYTGSVLRWEYSTNGGSTWTNIANTTAALPFSNVTVTTQYRAYVDVGSSCSDEYSSIATVTIGVGCRKGADAPLLTASWVREDAHLLLTLQPSKGTSIFLERSADGMSFDETGAEWSMEGNNRLAIDAGARNFRIPVLYYRVKYTSPGNVNYSEVVKLERNVIGETLHVFPNPATTSINIQSTDTEDLVSVSLMDLTGRPLGQRLPANEIEFDVSELPAGMYLVALKYQTEGMKVVKVVVTH
jgi:hypothetical protein